MVRGRVDIVPVALEAADEAASKADQARLAAMNAYRESTAAMLSIRKAEMGRTAKGWSPFSFDDAIDLRPRPVQGMGEIINNGIHECWLDAWVDCRHSVQVGLDRRDAGTQACRVYLQVFHNALNVIAGLC